MNDDSELLRRYAEGGSQDAFTLLVHRRFDFVYSVALRHVGGEAHLARDVAQRVFSDLARKAAVVATRPVVLGWLFRSALFASSDVVRAERRRRAREMEAQRMHDLSMTPVADADWDHLRPLLDHAMSALNDRDRDAVMLRVFEQHTYSEIGARLHLSEDAARMRVDRALEKLRRLLQRRGITSTAAALSIGLAGQIATAAPPGLAASVASGALASAGIGVAAAGSAGIATLMGTAKTTAYLAGVLALGAIGAGVYQAIESRTATVSTASLAQERDRLHERRDQLRAQMRPIEDRATPAESAPPTAGVRTAPPSDDGAERAFREQLNRTMEVIQARRRLRTSNPEYQELWVRATRAGTRLASGGLYRTLGLTSDQIERFENLVANKEWAQIDLDTATKQLGLPGDDPAVRALANAETDAFDTQLRELLGEAGHRQYQEYKQLAAVRGIVDRLAGNTYFLESPLSAKQSERLTELIASHNPHYQDSAQAWRTDGIDWDAVNPQARTILTPAQFAVWQAVVAEVRWSAAHVRALNNW